MGAALDNDRFLELLETLEAKEYYVGQRSCRRRIETEHIGCNQSTWSSSSPWSPNHWRIRDPSENVRLVWRDPEALSLCHRDCQLGSDGSSRSKGK
ncbi:Uncharacterised protein at_DN1224 [Pycnogonum litorale]